MKFKSRYEGACTGITITDEQGDELIVETREDGKKGLFIESSGMYLSRSKSLKLAWAIIEELNPSIL